MAAKKKRKPAARKAKKKSKAKRAPRVQAPRPAAAPAELRELDSEWKSFIEKTVPDEPLTEVWEAPKGAPSSKSTIRAATLKKATRAKTKKRKAPPGRKATAKRTKPAQKKAQAKRKTPARKKAKKK